MKIVKHYPDDFKLMVVRHYQESDEGCRKVARRFNLPSPCMVMNWFRKFGGDHPSYPVMNKPEKKEKPIIDHSDAAAMAKRIEELEQALESERLKNQVLNTMIDVAERDLKISIKKKSGAKQSKK
jgi:transposase